jgi:putative (di)nucleoside polyphosphate hydrolase
MTSDPKAPSETHAGLIYRPCVGLMVINASGQVWIGRRPNVNDSPEGAGSWWQMPQGGIDPGETPEQAAIRELWEETGITKATIVAEAPGWYTYDLPSYLHGKVWGGRYRGQRQKWFLMRFDGADHEVNITPGDAEKIEFDLWRWADMGEVVDLIVPFKREVYAQVVDAFAPIVHSHAVAQKATS